MKKKTESKKAPSKGMPKQTKPIRHTRSGELRVPPLFDRVSTILDAARSSVVRAVNSRMILAYWLIGREIVQELQGGDERAAYGKKLLQTLAQQLTERYGEGYSLSSLKDFKLLYTTYPDRLDTISHAARGLLQSSTSEGKSHAARGLLQPSSPSGGKSHPTGGFFEVLDALGRESAPAGKFPFHPHLSWTHYRAIMRVEKPHAREFYESECAAAGWNTRELERQIHSLYYERLLLSTDKKGMLQEQRDAAPKFDPASILKSSTVLEFLGLPDSPRLHESKLEQAIMDNLQTFLLELGRGFSFVARQKRLQFGDDEFYVDLVFYNYLLKCFVLIDLKMGKLTHQDIGQMDGYVRMYEDLYKVTGDNPTIGLILCTEKTQTIARYSVLKESQQLFASKYRLHLPTEEELAAELKREVLAIQEGGMG